MTPRINNTPYRRLAIPELSGGVNLRDGISLIQDNQLTDCNNVWYKNGILKTRPGIEYIKSKRFSDDITNTGLLRVYASDKNFRVINGITYFLTVFQYRYRLVFRYYSEQDGQFLEVATITKIPNADFHCNIFQQNTDIYCFCSGYYEGEDIPYYIYKISENDLKWQAERITEENMYVPIVMVNGGPNEDELDSPEKMKSIGAEMFEGYNMLGNSYKMYFSTAMKYEETADGEPIYDLMRYTLLCDTTNFVGKTVKAVITDINGNEWPHSVVINSNSGWQREAAALGDGRYMEVQGKMIRFINSATGEIAQECRSDYIANNLRITAPCENSPENYKKVLNMTFNDWYGGGSEGIYSGVHLFLGGNTDASEKSLVVWSDLNRPLYFSEGCYAYVGDKGQSVTAFGKQGESLIIFKERETYATQYVSNSLFDAETGAVGTLVDVAAESVSFPMTQVHGFIGCDCPDTVKLCRNRLVWAHSDGKVYVLVSASQYNERAIFEASAMVGRNLGELDKKSLRGALSADWQGMYMLAVGGKIYLMDYNSYGYASITSYTKNDDAQLHIPWWIWSLDTESPARLINVGGSLFAVDIVKDKANLMPVLYKFGAQRDSLFSLTGGSRTKEIPTKVQTKFFDFGTPTIKKSVPKIEVTFGGGGVAAITVQLITDGGSEDIEIYLEEPQSEEFSPSFFVNKIIRPLNQRANRFGLKLESNGKMAVDAVLLQYKQIGGIK